MYGTVHGLLGIAGPKVPSCFGIVRTRYLDCSVLQNQKYDRVLVLHRTEHGLSTIQKPGARQVWSNLIMNYDDVKMVHYSLSRLEIPVDWMLKISVRSNTI